MAFRIFLSHGRQYKRPQERKPDLAAVGVTGEHEVDEGPAGLLDNTVGVVGFVCHENDGAIGVGWHCEIKIRVAVCGVVESADPEAVAIAFDGDVLVYQNRSFVCIEGIDDRRGVVGDVMIAEAGEALGSGESRENLCTATDGMATGNEGNGAMGDEVSGEENQVGGESVDSVNDALEEEGLCVFVEVDIAELDNAKAVKRSGQISNGDGAFNDVDFVATNFASIERQTGGGGACG